MVPQPKVTKQTIVLQNISTQLLHSWFILEVEISFQEPLVQFNDLTKRQILPGRFVQSPSGLDELSPTQSISTATTRMAWTGSIPSKFRNPAP